MFDLYTQQDIVLFLARLVLGISFIKHGWPKIKKPLGLKDMLKEIGFPAPGFLSVAASVVEFFGGILILLGWHTQTAALLIAVVMIVAALILKFSQKKAWTDGYEIALAFLVLAMVLAVFGAGSWSIDY